MITIQKQLSFLLDNRPGTLARTCEALAKQRINLVALAIVETIDHAIVRLIVDDTAKAEQVLAQLPTTVQTRDVLVTDLPHDQPGVLAGIAQKLAAAGINIEYAYCTSPAAPGAGRLVLRTSDIEGTISALS
jgi:hypothetical protein